MTDSITLIQPDDWHVHVRSGEMLSRVVPYTAAQFGRALIMPNLSPPVVNVDQALSYRDQILNASIETNFDPKMSLYLTDNTKVEEVVAAAQCEHVLGFKLYPAGATTNSASGVSKITGVMSILEAMAEHNVVLQIHGEVTDSHIDIFDREAVFIDEILQPLHRELPELKFVLEHITTKEGIQFVESTNEQVGGTITPQHLLFNRNEIFREGIRPHAYCLPILKREQHRLSIIKAAISGNSSFFLGTDSAPHSRHAKQSDCGCAGIFSANAAIETYAQIFSDAGCLEKLEAFSSKNGAKFYGLPENKKHITLVNELFQIPLVIESTPHVEGEELIPLMAGETMSWKLLPDS